MHWDEKKWYIHNPKYEFNDLLVLYADIIFGLLCIALAACLYSFGPLIVRLGKYAVSTAVMLVQNIFAGPKTEGRRGGQGKADGTGGEQALPRGGKEKTSGRPRPVYGEGKQEVRRFRVTK